MGKLKTTKEHAEEAKALGRVVLVGTYNGARTPTTYRCIEHGEIHPSLPTNVLKGRGLLCCKSSGIKKE